MNIHIQKKKKAIEISFMNINLIQLDSLYG